MKTGTEHSENDRPAPGRWLNRNVFAFGLTSFLSDFCHEMATAVLPQFMQAIGASVAALGFVEGVADATSSFVKLGAGFHSDRIGRRKGWSVVGYALTAIGIALITFAFAWPLILLARVVGWLGRGIRGPLRDAMLAALLYTLRNVVYALASFPIGALSDRFSRTRYLAVGYGVAVVTFLGFAFVVPAVWWFAIFFALAGVFIAWEDTMEGVAVRDYVQTEIAGTAYGLLGVVNGIGDFVSSLMVGFLWAAVGPVAGFIYAAAVGTAGTVLMALTRPRAEGTGLGTNGGREP